MVKTILRFEGLVVFLGSLFIYNYLHFSWLFFLVLILLPDISMIGYLKDKRVGAITYNLGHNYILAAVIFLLGWCLNKNFPLGLGVIWAAHVGIDRFMGFGLKYFTNFKDTHLQKV